VSGEQHTWPVQFAVERGKCLELARVLRAPAGPYLEGRRLTAVPTFPVVSNHWGFSGAEVLRDLGCDMKRILHGGEEYEYPNGPLLEGQEVRGEQRLLSRESRTAGDGSPLTVLVLETILTDAVTGDIAVRIRRTLLERGAVQA
jgi:N-terminal half of MaoC dehydratase